MTGINIAHVPYRGAGPAMVDLMGGQIQMMFNVMSASLQYVKAGKLRALGVATKTRQAALPDVPTVAETVPGFEASSGAASLARKVCRRKLLKGSTRRPMPDCETPMWWLASPSGAQPRLPAPLQTSANSSRMKLKNGGKSFAPPILKPNDRARTRRVTGITLRYQAASLTVARRNSLLCSRKRTCRPGTLGDL